MESSRMVCSGAGPHPASPPYSLSLSSLGVLLSMGFGFVEYKKPEQAQKALKQLQVRQGFLGHHGETRAQERPRKNKGLSHPP